MRQGNDVEPDDGYREVIPGWTRVRFQSEVRLRRVISLDPSWNEVDSEGVAYGVLNHGMAHPSSWLECSFVPAYLPKGVVA